MFYRKTNAKYNKPAEGIEFKTLSYGENTQLCVFRVQKGSGLPLHEHPHEQTGYLISGKIILIIENEKYEMTEEQSRLRENISVLGETTQESKLREKYVAKLTTQENRFESISTEIKKLETDLNKLNKEIDTKISKLKVK